MGAVRLLDHVEQDTGSPANSAFGAKPKFEVAPHGRHVAFTGHTADAFLGTDEGGGFSDGGDDPIQFGIFGRGNDVDIDG